MHLTTSTVREALQFSAYLRQSDKISKKEKDEYVDLLEMTSYGDALVGVAGEGLNVEQRKRLTIGVEPKLLLFLAIRLTNRAVDLQIDEKIGRSWTSYLVPSALCPFVAGI